MPSARAPRRSARDASSTTTAGSASASASAAAAARGSATATGAGSTTSGASAGRERAIEQLIDADPRGPYYRASRIMVSCVVFVVLGVCVGCCCRSETCTFHVHAVSSNVPLRFSWLPRLCCLRWVVACRLLDTYILNESFVVCSSDVAILLAYTRISYLTRHLYHVLYPP